MVVPHREMYWSIPYHNLIYLFLLVALAIFGYTVWQKYRLWTLGKPEKRWDQFWRRLFLVIWNSFGHPRLLREWYPGGLHFILFWGIVVMIFAAALEFFQAWFGLHLLYGSFYLVVSWALDVFGLLGIIAILLFAVRRYIQRPARLDNKPDDAWVLLIVLLILCTGFLLEGLRISAKFDPWAAWTPVGNWVATWFAGTNPETAISAYQILWWFHFALVMGVIVYTPYSKFFHVLTSPLNQFFQNLGPRGVCTAIDFENEEIEQFGVANLGDFTWKQLFELEACVRCGRCQDNCPAHLSGKPLSPKEMTQNLKTHLLEKGPLLVKQKEDQKKGAEAEKEVAAAGEKERAILEKSIIGDVITEDEIWACTTCRSCMEQCPSYVEHIDRIIELRRNLVLMESRFPSEMQLAFRNMENNANPWGVGWASRADWAEGLEVKVLAEDSDVEILYWPGCAGAFDDRNKRVAVAMVKLMKAAGVNFGILGTEEKCCGDSARKLGNEYLFQSLAQENIETLKGYNVKKIVTQCPHCYNTLAKDYRQFGGEFEVWHHTEFLLDLIKTGRLKPARQLDKRVTYHDSCYLGRYNEIYAQPRNILKSIPGVSLVEMARREKKSFCCGAGGGRMWLEETLGQKLYLMRTEQALELNPDIIAVACPFCLTMLFDGVKAKEVEEKVQTLDIAEIIAQAVEV